ncbi:hypothetical protein WR25_19533 [Diploscapter pachys]|uniref:Uncharacterized protein n=1 Tax=Diploscapter pachys TaxID=2018661 RepID=A0A2A2JEJ4_9BILA|nr:hypothetical protein WR25_19533 [Diploscapter pachys]
MIRIKNAILRLLRININCSNTTNVTCSVFPKNSPREDDRQKPLATYPLYFFRLTKVLPRPPTMKARWRHRLMRKPRESKKPRNHGVCVCVIVWREAKFVYLLVVLPGYPARDN